jgi:hypothetical protein
MRASVIRVAGLACAVCYGAFIVWLYGQQPRTISQVTGKIRAEVGAYRIDDAAFAEGRRFFGTDQFAEARIAFARADPARQDATVQFYVAYSYYREGWGRLYHDDRLYRAGLEALDAAEALSPNHGVRVDDPTLQMATSTELRAELDRGIAKDASDLNPLKVFRTRK